MGVIASFLQKLLPREEKFYHVLADLADLSGKTLDSLEKFMRSGASGEQENLLAEEIADARKRAKAMCDTLSEQLSRSFITPFDREDMLEFANMLNRNIKLIDKIKNRLVRHKVAERQNDFSRMMKIMQTQVQILREIVGHLNDNNMDETQAGWSRLSDLEREADELLEQLITELMQGQMTMQEAFVRKDIYEMFERLSDAYRDAGTVAVQIVLKHN